MVSMQGYINAHCAAAQYDRSYDSREFFGGGYDDYEPEPQQPAETFDATPDWLLQGLEQYLELGGPEGTVTPRQPDEDFGHLAADAGPSTFAAFHEVTSDVLYIPPAAKVGRAALGGDVFVVRAHFSFGNKSETEPTVKPSFLLNVAKVGGSSRKDAIEASRTGDGIELRAEDVADTREHQRSRVVVNAGIKGKTPRINKPTVREFKGSGWVDAAYPDTAANGLLKVCLSPILDPRVKRVRIDARTS
jgi:hypothetical protein